MHVTDGENIGSVVYIEPIGYHKPITVRWLKNKDQKSFGTKCFWPAELFEIIELNDDYLK